MKDKYKIETNYTSETYNKKYKHSQAKLLKITKKEVETFDKKYLKNTNEKNFLLQGKRWALIKDTYYEIPKPLSFAWFRNCNAGFQTIMCLLFGGAVASGVVLPTYYLVVKSEIHVENVKLDIKSFEQFKTTSITLKATVYPENASNKNIKWSSSDTSVCTVNESGKVTGIKEGKATITATTEDGNKTDTCEAIFNENTLNFSFDENNKCTVSASNECVGEINIPSEVKHNNKTYKVTKIGDFKNKTEITKITFPKDNNITELGHDNTSGFQGCTKLESINFEVLTKLDSNSLAIYTFKGCSSLKSITLPSHLESLESSMFYDCTSLSKVELPSSLKKLPSYIFCNCEALTTIELPSSLEAFDGSRHFSNSGITAVNNLEKSKVTKIPASTFYNCNKLTTIDISKITHIGSDAFRNCTSLAKENEKSFDIPSSVIEIGEGAFTGCGIEKLNIYSKTIAEENDYVGKGLYDSCKEVNIPSDATPGKQIANAFEKSTGNNNDLIKYVLKSEAFIYVTLYSKNYALFKAGESFSKTSYTLPLYDDANETNIVIGFANGCFKNNKTIQSVSTKDKWIENRRFELNESAFEGCTALTSFDYSLPSPPISTCKFYIGVNAFKGCTSLATFTVGSYALGIKANAFEGCTSLKTIIMDSDTVVGANDDEGKLYTNADTVKVKKSFVEKGIVGKAITDNFEKGALEGDYYTYSKK